MTSQSNSPTASPKRYILAIDLGSGGPKVGLVCEDGTIAAHTRRSISTYTLPNGGAEQDPEEWWSSITSAAREVVGANVVPREQIVAVSCTSQWSVTVPVDRDGRHLMNALHWLDTRGAPYTHAVTDGWIKVSGYGARRLMRWLRMTGGAPTHSGVDALAHMLFIKHARLEIYRQTAKLLEPADYINSRLTGRCAATYATVFPYLLTDNRDVERIDYDPQLIKWTGLDRAKLPDLLPVDAVLGTIRRQVADEWGLDPRTQVIVATPDSQAAAIGSGAVHDYDGHFTVGTSSWMSCHVPFKKTDLTHFIATMPSAVRGRNMVMAEQGAAGKCLEILADQWLFDVDPTRRPLASELYEHLQQLALSAQPGSGGVLFLPWLNGAGPPSGDRDTRGGFLNLSLGTGRAELARSVMEGVAFNLRWVMKYVEKFIGRRFDQLNFIGGAAQSEVWCQMHADILNRPVRQVAEPRLAVVRGAGFIGLAAMGILKLHDVPDKVAIARTFEPDPRHRRLYDALFAEFVQSYKANRRIFSRLQRARSLSDGNS